MLIENISFKNVFQAFDVLYLWKQKIFHVIGMRINLAPEATLNK